MVWAIKLKMATKEWVGWIATLAIFCSLFAIGLSNTDVECKARTVDPDGPSIVCVCDQTHCDNVRRVNPQRDTFVMYTTTRAGKRFERTNGRIRDTRDEVEQFEAPSDTEEDVDTTFGVPPYLDEDSVPDYENPEGFNLLPDPDVPSDLDASILSTLVKNHVQHEKPDPYVDAEDSEDYEDREERNRFPITIPDLPNFTLPDFPSFTLPDLSNFTFPDLSNFTFPDLGDFTLPPIRRRNETTIQVFPSTRHQSIEGFGGSVTDAAAINWRKLSPTVQQHLIDSYFGPNGLEYNLIRVPIGGSDFSTHPYTYNELPWNDHALSNFELTDEDYLYKLPMIKEIQKVATSEVKVTASTWSPPVWMKTNEQITGFAQLKPEFFQTYADYHLRFLEEYDKNDVPIWAITTTNEPLNGIVPLVQFNSLGFAPWQLAKYIVENLGPTIRNSRFNRTLILGVDDQRYMLPIYLNGMVKEDPKFLEYLDGIAVHYYGNFAPAAILGMIQSRLPGKILLATEACEGAMPWQQPVEEGSWRRARRYVSNILEDLNNHVVGWIDWNLCLDRTGGPNWANNFVDAPILVNAEQDEFVKQPMFYAMGHFSKFIPRGSEVISTSRRGARLENIAVIKPDRNIVVVIQNRRRIPVTVTIHISTFRFIRFEMEAESIKTIEFNP